MNTKQTNFLKGLGVLVTRTEPQGQQLCQRIIDLHGQAWSFPTVTLVKMNDQKAIIDSVKKLAETDIAIFVSPNAVTYSFDYIKEYFPLLPNHLSLIAVGKGTATAVQQQGQTAIYPSQAYNSEAVLDLPILQAVAGKVIRIFSGVGGRELLATELSKRGAKVVKVPVYRRQCPQQADAALIALFEQQNINMIVITSSEGLENLFTILGPDKTFYIKQMPLLLISEKMQVTASALGYQGKAIMAANASNEAILESLLNWCKERNDE